MEGALRPASSDGLIPGGDIALPHDSESSNNLSLSDRGLLIRLTERVAGLSQRIDGMKTDFSQILTEHKQRQGDTERDVEKRMRTLENFRWWFVGAIFGAGALSGGIAALVTKLLSPH